MDELTRAALAAQHGGPPEMAAFIRASYTQVWTFCAHLVDPESADDLTQDSYLRIFRALRSFRRDASARAWILSITRRACIDELRRRVRRRDRERLSPDPVDDAGAEQADPDVTGVRALLARLEPDRRAAFALTQLLGLSYDEAARVMGCPPGTIRSRVARARSELISHVDPHGWEGQDADAR